MVKILISGLLVYDSGKTWLAISLAKRLKGYGHRVGIYKPIAGHNAWTQYKTVVISKKLGILVGEDVFNYISILGMGKEIIPFMNPIDILLAPPEVASYIRDLKIEEYLMDLEDQYKQMILGRISSCLSGESIHYLFWENLDRITLSLRSKIIELSQTLNAKRLDLYSFINRITDTSIEKDLNICLDTIAKNSDIVIIESFNDAITPYASLLENVDGIVIASPGAVMIYRDVNKIYSLFRKVFEKYGSRGYKSMYIVNELQPDNVISIEPREDIHESVIDKNLNQILDYITK
ncbi:conserved hypothetical protein [Ignisphaera aggregans DSM 17230]|uniref:ATPase n=1 Tax=Ignisphaera aggregans (strain DSM 17230 / JCM 13409 / AQ1.S1) TaxID=583356 RepID=E0SSJ9_IGNAA|nr:conserved hypothetical protein [Ignisphaera aggregans DSM 17230]